MAACRCGHPVDRPRTVLDPHEAGCPLRPDPPAPSAAARALTDAQMIVADALAQGFKLGGLSCAWLEREVAAALTAAEARGREEAARQSGVAWRELHTQIRDYLAHEYDESGCERGADELCKIVESNLHRKLTPSAESAELASIPPSASTGGADDWKHKLAEAEAREREACARLARPGMRWDEIAVAIRARGAEAG